MALARPGDPKHEAQKRAGLIDEGKGGKVAQDPKPDDKGKATQSP